MMATKVLRVPHGRVVDYAQVALRMDATSNQFVKKAQGLFYPLRWKLLPILVLTGPSRFEDLQGTINQLGSRQEVVKATFGRCFLAQ